MYLIPILGPDYIHIADGKYLLSWQKAAKVLSRLHKMTSTPSLPVYAIYYRKRNGQEINIFVQLDPHNC